MLVEIERDRRTRDARARSALHAALLALVLLLLVPAVASAAELRGRIWDAKSNKAPKGGELELDCGSKKLKAELKGNGSYSIRNVPPDTSCTLTVSIGSRSARRTINVNGPVVRFDAEISTLGKRILIIAH